MASSRERTFWELIAALEEHPEWKAQLRQMLLSEELLKLPEQVAAFEQRTQEEFTRVWEAIGRLTESLQRLTERVDQLTERVDQLARDLQQLARRVDQLTERVDQLARDLQQLARRVDQLTERVDQLARDLQQLTLRVDRLVESVTALVSWQQGEEGRRRGEAYERKIILTAPRLFHGGDGGPPADPMVRRKLLEWLDEHFDELEDEEADVFLADLIWWKGNKVAVVEISWKVNGKDVERAARRAEVLRRVGVDAFGVVIGQEWAVDDTRKRAYELGVAWYVGGELSTHFVEFRKRKWR